MLEIEEIRNETEKEIAERLRKIGCRVFRPAWPDFIIISKTGKVFFTEIKLNNEAYNSMSKKQEETLKLLSNLGFNIRIVLLDGTIIEQEEIINKVSKGKDKRISKSILRKEEKTLLMKKAMEYYQELLESVMEISNKGKC